MDEDGNRHYCVDRPARVDGAGSTRACNHRIIGDGHAKVAVSALTKSLLCFGMIQYHVCTTKM